MIMAGLYLLGKGLKMPGRETKKINKRILILIYRGFQMISTNDFHNGMTIVIDGTVYQIIEFQHFKMGRGGALVKTKLRDVENGGITEKTFRGGEKVERAHVDQRQKQFLYRDGSDFIFMDTETFEQISLSEEQLGDKANYLQENMVINVLMYNGRPIDIELPTTVDIEVQETPPGIRAILFLEVLNLLRW